MDFVVDRSDFTKVQCRSSPPIVLGEGQALIKVERFAFTSNNLTYATAGESIGYFKFFPCLLPTGETDSKNAIIPVWGIGQVVASRSEDAKVGEQYYGYFPMSSYCVVTPKASGNQGFTDAAKHREALPPVYNNYVCCSTDPLYNPENEAFMCINRPLYLTSWILDDFLNDNKFFGADGVVLSSASSKTSLGLAWELKANNTDKKVIGLTSPKNVDFVKSLNTYDQVLAYPDVGSKDLAAKTVVYVDMSGNARLLKTIHNTLDENLKYSCLVGKTHWDSEGGQEKMKGPDPQFFFAPSQFQKRGKEWGSNKLNTKMAKSWFRYTKQALQEKWCVVQECDGAEEVDKVYKQFIDGSVDPRQGFICSLWDPSKL